jgi:putative FmdB family regulatory protein
MPIYKYRCQSCHIEFELPQTYIEKTLTVCPNCRKGILQRIPQLPAVIFKGSGWYSIDHMSAQNHKTRAAEPKSDKPQPPSKAKSLNSRGG